MNRKWPTICVFIVSRNNKYRPGHKCEGQLFTLMVLADNEENDDGVECLEEEEEEVEGTSILFECFDWGAKL